MEIKLTKKEGAGKKGAGGRKKLRYERKSAMKKRKSIWLLGADFSCTKSAASCPFFPAPIFLPLAQF
jgi:hypothetical protein